MSLFQKSVITKQLQSQDKPKLVLQWNIFKNHFHNKLIQDNIRSSKEEQYQGEFLIDLFVNVLGYVKNPTPNFTLMTEYKNVKDSKKADGAILVDTKVKAVIELKGTNTTDLGKIEVQAFGYKNNQPDCVYVITSNFEKLRFYIDNATEFLEFNLFQLTEKEFELLYLCLAYDNIANDIPQKLKEQSISKEKDITKDLYRDYSQFKRELHQNLVRQNSNYDALELFQKSQKLLDRFLFLFFAEDRQLLPPNSVRLILKQWEKLKELDEYVPLYARFKKYFGYLNTGFKGKQHDVFAYNGGLFKPDEILDNIIIDDELLYKHTLKLSEYDFVSEVDVNILGHIFENSLNELDEVKAQLDGGAIDKANTKRKKDGVFYTPKYITKYIVDNTVGKLCANKKEEYKIVEEDYFTDKKRNIKTKRPLVEKLTTYRKWLLQITICDPACGSGAFLNQALDFLIKEHQYIDELQAKLLGEALVLSDVEKSILENNLFGVDLNEESVEIAKLSLWLRTARPNRKLNDLNNNIKCGNSLIDDVKIAGEKAFDWHVSFAKIFENGGFDIIIGNPPYVGEKGHSEIFENLKKVPKWNEFYRRRSNTYYFFIKHGIDLLKENGFQSLIIPREFTNADWSNKVRQDIIENSKIIEIVDFNNLKVFEDAGTTSLILTQQKQKQFDYSFRFKNLNQNNYIENNLFDKLYSTRSVNKLISDDYKPWSFNTFEINFSDNVIPLGGVFDIAQGLVTGADKITNKHVASFLIEEKFVGRGIFILTLGRDLVIDNNNFSLKINDEWIALDDLDKSFIKPYYKPEHLQKWFVACTSTFVLYVGNNYLTENIKKYLLQFDKVLLNRSTTNENKIITLNEFENFSIDEIKLNYSSAGAVQKIMRQKKWYLPLYERVNVPFDNSKIVVNTKNMNVFTFSDLPLYSSGGGAGGQNFIYLKEEFKKKTLKSDNDKIKEFTMYVNAILNSRLIQFHIQNGQFNQLSTSKIADLPLYIPSFEAIGALGNYDNIINYCRNLIEYSVSLNSIIDKFYEYVKGYFPNLDVLKIRNWNELSFADFIAELNKASKTFSTLPFTKKEEFEWIDLFSENKTKANNLKLKIEKEEKVIDALVYKLYDLTDDEILIVENS
ncbi:HsdM family class I SAM-dependent methyltransferase [Pedobacter jamesrossensis]|uniref:site-specific DNA-methyltransferase (adenine-specific) n=1 Tax=Pedobacter jamesrossensis TaxID=1908238 RepID=A0ABV8NIK6_9SPHI